MMPHQWYVARNNKKHGPFTAAKLKELAAQGRLHPTDMLLREGMQKWVPASTVGGLFPEQPSGEPMKDEGEQTTTGSALGNPLAWVQGQFQMHPQRVLLAGGGAALVLLFVVCVRVVSMLSGGRSESSAAEKDSYKELIVGKWKDELGIMPVEYTADGKYVMALAPPNAYTFIAKDKVRITAGDEEVFVFTVRVTEDELTETDDKGKSVTYKRVGRPAKKTPTKSVAADASFDHRANT